MNERALREAVALAEQVGGTLVATADADGRPHVAAARVMTLDEEHMSLAVDEWFCPGTVANLGVNRRVALVAYDCEADRGYQVLGEGEVEAVEQTGVLDALGPDELAGHPVPQIERRLIIRPDRLLAFTQAPHTDADE